MGRFIATFEQDLKASRWNVYTKKERIVKDHGFGFFVVSPESSK